VIKLAVDENFDRHILRALLRRVPELDFRTVQGQAMAAASDIEVLAWAASEGRVLLTHDVRTVTRYAYERVAMGAEMPGVVEVPSLAPMSEVLDDLVLLLSCATVDDLIDQVVYIPWPR
jgi:hypothetical protein